MGLYLTARRITSGWRSPSHLLALLGLKLLGLLLRLQQLGFLTLVHLAALLVLLMILV